MEAFQLVHAVFQILDLILKHWDLFCKAVMRTDLSGQLIDLGLGNRLRDRLRLFGLAGSCQTGDYYASQG